MLNIEEFFKKIGDSAKEQGIKVGVLEEAAGVSKGYLGRLKKEQKLPSAEALQKIAEKLGVSIDYLLEETADGDSEEDLLCAKFINKISVNTRLKNIEWEYWNINLGDKKSREAVTKDLPPAFFNEVSGIPAKILVETQGNCEVNKITCARACMPAHNIILYCYYYEADCEEICAYALPSEFALFMDDENGLNLISSTCFSSGFAEQTELSKAMGNLYRAVIREAKLNKNIARKMLDYLEADNEE